MTRAAKRTDVPCVDEESYKAAMGAGARAVEAILRTPHPSNILIEAKMGLFPELTLLTDSERNAHEALRSRKQLMLLQPCAIRQIPFMTQGELQAMR